MTTDCFTDFNDRAAEAHRSSADAGEIGAAIVTAIGFVLMLPGAAAVMSLLHTQS